MWHRKIHTDFKKMYLRSSSLSQQVQFYICIYYRCTVTLFTTTGCTVAEVQAERSHIPLTTHRFYLFIITHFFSKNTRIQGYKVKLFSFYNTELYNEMQFQSHFFLLQEKNYYLQWSVEDEGRICRINKKTSLKSVLLLHRYQVAQVKDLRQIHCFCGR